MKSVDIDIVKSSLGLKMLDYEIDICSMSLFNISTALLGSSLEFF